MVNGGVATDGRMSDYFGLVRRHWAILLVGLLLGLAGAGAYLALAPREYRVETAVLVTAPDLGSGGGSRSGTNLDTEAELVTSTETVAAVAEELGVPADELADLRDRVFVSVPPNSDILEISFTGDTPEDAQAGSLAFAEAYLAQRADTTQAALDVEAEALEARIAEVSEQQREVLADAAALPARSAQRVQADARASVLNNQLAALGNQLNQVRSQVVSPGRVITQPDLPSRPTSPDTWVVITAGLLLGLLAALAVAALRHRSDDRIRTSDGLARRAGIPVAAELEGRLHPGDARILPLLSTDGRAYARVRNLVSTALRTGSPSVVLVPGVQHGGGPVAVNLAAALARGGEDVYLICADVFGGTSAALLPDPAGPGLAEVLAGDVELEAAVQRIEDVPNLRVLGSGRDLDRADALLQTRRPRQLVDRLVEAGAFVVIEAPSTTNSPDAQTLAHVAGGVVLVIELGRTTVREVLDARAQFESMGTPVLGAVAARYGRGGEPRRRDEGRPGQHAAVTPRGTAGGAGSGATPARAGTRAATVSVGREGAAGGTRPSSGTRDAAPR